MPEILSETHDRRVSRGNSSGEHFLGSRGGLGTFLREHFREKSGSAIESHGGGSERLFRRNT